MKPGYTVAWSPSTDNKLAQIWLDNPAIRNEITNSVAEIGAALKHIPGSSGVLAPGSGQTRVLVRPPISVLYQVSEADRLVRVLDIKLWDD